MTSRNRYFGAERLASEIATIEYELVGLRNQTARKVERLGYLRMMMARREMNEAPVTALKYGINDCQCAAEFDGSGYELL